MDKKNRSKKNVNVLQSVNNAFRAIEVLTEVEEIGVTHLSQKLGIGKSTAFRILTTLEVWGYVKKNEDTSRYRLGMKFADIGAIVLDRLEIVNYARPYLEQLTSQFNETSHLGILEDNYNIRFIDKVRGTTMFSMKSLVGGTTPAYCTGMGKAILANLPSSRIESYLQNVKLERFTPNTITDKDEFLEELGYIRDRGYSIDNEENELGLTCYGAPIFDSSNTPIAAISVSGSTPKMREKKDEMIQGVISAARSISQLIK
ncbi:MAG TPA: IclR family transcriptional regulator [Tepidimicrobium sp.]|nr:IclR family transcriptional regulator [Tepidimicrobium sp.]